MNLADEIAEAEARLAALKRKALAATCDDLGHDWKLIGGANCGCFKDSGCSIPVMECTRCGDCDYGDSDEANEKRASCLHRIEYMETQDE